MFENMQACMDSQIPQDVSGCTANHRQAAIAFENALNDEEAMENRNNEAEPRFYVEKAVGGEFRGIVGESPALKAA